MDIYKYKNNKLKIFTVGGKVQGKIINKSRFIY